MEIIIALAVVVIVAALLIFKNSSTKALETLDVNKDGKVDMNDVTAAVDLNKDGKVDVQDAKVAINKAKATVKTRTQRKNKSNGSSTKH